jgi:hypothetical protein
MHRQAKESEQEDKKISPQDFIRAVEQADYKTALSNIRDAPIAALDLGDLITEGLQKTSNFRPWMDLFTQISWSYSVEMSMMVLEGVLTRNNNNPALCGNICSVMLRASLRNNTAVDKMMNLLTSDVEFIPSALSVLRDNPGVQIKLINKLILLCIEKNNACLLYAIGQNYALPKMRTFIGDLPLAQKQKIIHLLSLDAADRLRTTIYFPQFFNGFGKIKFNGALLTCAQVAVRKNYVFNPTVLHYLTSFEPYLNLLKEDYRPCRARFVMADSHWMAGDIEIQADGRTRFLLIDPLGYEDDSFNLFGSEDMLRAFAKVFPGSEIYYSSTVRQHTDVGCSVFALDDVRHLYTAEKYLEEKYKKTGLFGYLSDQKSIVVRLAPDEKISHQVEVKICHLPLSLERTMQSKDLYKEIEKRSSSEQNQKVNKKNQTAKESVDEGFEDFKTGEKVTKKNNRLQKKLQKMAMYNEQYLRGVPKEEMDVAMKSFTLEDYQRRHIPTLIKQNAWDLVEKELAKLPAGVRFSPEIEKAMEARELRGLESKQASTGRIMLNLGGTPRVQKIPEETQADALARIMAEKDDDSAPLNKVDEQKRLQEILNEPDDNPLPFVLKRQN